MTNYSAFVLRVAPGRESRLDYCLSNHKVIIGWGCTELLVQTLDWQQFRQIIHDQYYSEKDSYRTSGNVSGHVWRFLREMKHGDRLVVPAPAGEFYVARITSIEPIQVLIPDEGFIHSVEWLNDGKPIPRLIASARMQSRMKVQGTTAYASDLIGDIEKVLDDAKAFIDSGIMPSFESDLRKSLIDVTVSELRNGKIDSYKMEQIISDLLRARGFNNPEITARMLDKGDDIFAELYTIGGFSIPIVIQVKHYYDTTSPLSARVVDELINGMRKRDTQYGLIVTAGTVSPEATQAAFLALEEHAMQITILDGKELSEEYLNYVVGAKNWSTQSI